MGAFLSAVQCGTICVELTGVVIAMELCCVGENFLVNSLTQLNSPRKRKAGNN